MRKSIAVATTSIIAALAAVTLSAGPALASTTRVSTPILLASLQLTKTGIDGKTVPASLNCVRGINVYGQTYVNGNGTVTDPTAACQELAAVGGDFTKLNVHPTWLVSALVAPVKVTATGRWASTSVNYAQSFGNPTLLAKNTGDVFAF